jgi:hypothetical protein
VLKVHASAAKTNPQRDADSPPETRRALILLFWAVLICFVDSGSLSPVASSVMVGIGRVRVRDKLLHFGAYLAPSALPHPSSRRG